MKKSTAHIISLKYWFLFAFLFLLSRNGVAQRTSSVKKITVALDGSGDYKSIQAAINSLSDSSTSTRIIFIQPGVYHEKLYIEKNNIIFEGADRDKTIITQAIARDEWRCLHNEDWGVATMNVDGDDITLKNLTVTNSYGFDIHTDRIVSCPLDSIHQKVIPNNGHQMALRTMNATRFKAINVHFRAYAGDTVSPWNVENGMFYFKDCIMEGGVDFYCPRGWAYAENCTFIANTGPASIWHDGSKNPDSKTVLMNCIFKGYDGFKLGRYHKDAQFYLINCQFAHNMADQDIYLVPTNNIIQWGRRVYYYNCHRNGGDYAWFKDNLSTANGAPDAAQIDANWVFKGKWHPQNNL